MCLQAFRACAVVWLIVGNWGPQVGIGGQEAPLFLSEEGSQGVEDSTGRLPWQGPRLGSGNVGSLALEHEGRELGGSRQALVFRKILATG